MTQLCEKYRTLSILMTKNNQDRQESCAIKDEGLYSLRFETLDMSGEERAHLEEYVSSIHRNKDVLYGVQWERRPLAEINK